VIAKSKQMILVEKYLGGRGPFVTQRIDVVASSAGVGVG
jgi:hypothetical protein